MILMALLIIPGCYWLGSLFAEPGSKGHAFPEPEEKRAARIFFPNRR